ncbi:MAG: hypothetical protein ABI723_00750 [Bacteroidia bacterium]
MKNSIVILLMLLIIFSCSKKTTPTSAQQPVQQPKVDSTSVPVDMTMAENQFKQTCGSCHALPSPAKHIAAEWPNTVNRMQRKKGFDDSQKEQILAYLVANAKQ